MRRLVLASGNRGKLAEMQTLLAPLGFELVARSTLGVGDVEETGMTFVENAIIKARHTCAATGLPALADDSGIEVDALGGAPGVRSARYAGPDSSDADNLLKLLDALVGVPAPRRAARFHCVIALLRAGEDPVPVIFHGVWEGCVLDAPRGDGGFGYDPIFLPRDGDGLCAAELSSVDKNRLSHRGKALAALVTRLRQHRDGEAL